MGSSTVVHSRWTGIHKRDGRVAAQKQRNNYSVYFSISAR